MKLIALILSLLALSASIGALVIVGREDPTALTPADVAWAGDTRIWKIDTTGMGALYGYRLIVLGPGDRIVARGPMIGGREPIPSDPASRLVRISCHRNGDVVSGKFSAGSGMTYAFTDQFPARAWATVGEPVLLGDVMHLAADSTTFGFGPRPFDPASHVLSLELIRQPRDSADRP